MISARETGILVDLDGTLHVSPKEKKHFLRDNSWLELTYWIGIEIHRLDEAGAEQLARAHGALYVDFRRGLLTLEELESLLMRLWTNNGEFAIRQDQILKFVERFQYRPNSEEIIDALNQLGTTTLATGSFDLAAQVATEKHGIEYHAANSTLEFTKSEESDQFYYWRGYDHNSDMEEVKFEYAKRFIQEHNLQRFIVIGDDGSDGLLFSAKPEDLGVKELIKVAIGKKHENQADIVIRSEEDWLQLPILISEYLQRQRPAA